MFENVKFVTLITGEVILCDFIGPTSGTVTLKSPVKIRASQTAEGNIGIEFIPVNPFSLDDEFEVLLSHVVYVQTPVDDIVKGYEQECGSGLALPPENKLIV